MKKMIPKILLVGLVLLLIFLFRYYGISDYLTLDYIKQNQSRFAEYYQHNQFQTLGLFFILYVITTAVSLPGATVLTLAAGALFGLVTGVILVSFASTIGATLAFLSSRFLFRGYVESKFKKYIDPINKGIEKRRGLLSFYIAFDSPLSLLCHQSGHGNYKNRYIEIFLCESVGDVGRHNRLCKRRAATWQARIIEWHFVI